MMHGAITVLDVWSKITEGEEQNLQLIDLSATPQVTNQNREKFGITDNGKTWL